MDINLINESQNERAKKIKDDIQSTLKDKKISITLSDSTVIEYSLETYLQGSYKKKIDIKSSDIDILLTTSRLPKIDELENFNYEKNRKWQLENNTNFADGNFERWGNNPHFRDSILKKLGNRSIFNNDIVLAKKEIKNILLEIKRQIKIILESSPKFNNANISFKNNGIQVTKYNGIEEFDVIPSIIYFYVDDRTKELTSIGVTIFNEYKDLLITNFPRYDWSKTSEKNQTTDRKYKKVIRWLKKQNENISIDLDGFSIEQIIYNVPNFIFSNSSDDRTLIISIFNWLKSNLNKIKSKETKFACTNFIAFKCDEDFQKLKNKDSFTKMRVLISKIEKDNDF